MQSKERLGANDPGMSRRALLVAAPALALAGSAQAAPITIKLAADTPVMALFRQWRAAQDAEDAAYAADLSDAETNRIADTRSQIEKRLMLTPCQTAEDFICKVIAHTAFGVFAMPDQEKRPDLWAEARVLIGGAA